MDDCYSEKNFKEYCDLLAGKDKRLYQIILDHGYPPFWHREPGYSSLVRIILEQQVSLASALATFKKLKNLIGEITPQKVLSLSAEDLKTCGFSRQKTQYVWNLAEEIDNGNLSLGELPRQSSSEIRDTLISVKGIGHWTIDVFLLNCLHKLDIFPLGDLVLLKSLVQCSFIKKDDSRETIFKKTKKFRPYRSILSILLWHKYIKENRINGELLE